MTGSHRRLLMLGAEWIGQRPGGMNRYFAELAAALSDAAVEVEMLLVGDEATALHGTVGARGSDPTWRRILQYTRTTLRRMKDVEIVDAHFALYAFLPTLFSRRLRQRLVVHFQGPWARESAVGRGQGRAPVALKRIMERVVYRRAVALVTLSDAFKQLLVRDYAVDSACVHVIPPGVDLEKFSPGHGRDARARFACSADTFTVVCARRLEHRMGLDTLIRAWGLLAPGGGQLLIAGEGAQRQHLQGLIERLSAPKSVTLLGRLSDDDLVSLYRAGDCSVVPSRQLEGFGLIVLESLACGTPAIVTDVGGLPEIMRQFDASLIVPREDERSMAQRLTTARAGSLPSASSCRTFAERYSWADVAKAHLDLYSSVSRVIGSR